MTSTPEILVYTAPACGYCGAAKSLLRAKGVSFREIDVSEEDGKREEMIRRSGSRSVPQIFIGSEHVGGYEELSALNQQGKLDALLGISG